MTLYVVETVPSMPVWSRCHNCPLPKELAAWPEGVPTKVAPAKKRYLAIVKPELKVSESISTTTFLGQK
jgi:hypothetical protein